MPAPAESAIGPMDTRTASAAIAELFDAHGLDDGTPVPSSRVPSRSEDPDLRKRDEDDDAPPQDDDDDLAPLDEADDRPPATENAEDDDDDVEDQDDDEAYDIPDDVTVTVKVDGKKVKITGKELKSGYSRTADYTQKAQAVAQARAEAAAERQATQQERQELLAALAQVRENLQTQAPEQPDADLYYSDPQEFAYQSEMYRRHQEQQQRVTAAQQELAHRSRAEQERAHADLLKSERDLLLARVPAWKDPKREERDQKLIASYAESVGYTADDMKQVFDHRAVQVLRDAARYRALQAQTTTGSRPTVEEAPTPARRPRTPTLRPGNAAAEAGPKGALDRAMSRAADTGLVRDAAAAISRLKL